MINSISFSPNFTSRQWRSHQSSQPETERYYGMSVTREVTSQNPYTAILRAKDTNQIVGLKEGNYTLVQKDDELREITENWVKQYIVINDLNTGKVEKLIEDNYPNDAIMLTEDSKGNIVLTTQTQSERVMNPMEEKGYIPKETTPKGTQAKT